MRYTVLSLFMLSFLSCKEEKKPAEKIYVQAKQEQQLVDTGYRDSSLKSMMIHIGEAEIRQEQHEVYRLLWFFPFSKPSILFRVEKLDDKVILITKVFRLIQEDTLFNTVVYNNQAYRITKDTLLNSGTQVISINEWNEFKNIILSTYYWNYENPYIERCVLDGDGLIMQSVSNHYLSCFDSLRYHVNDIHAPDAGFRKALLYLKNKSVVIKGLEI